MFGFVSGTLDNNNRDDEKPVDVVVVDPPDYKDSSSNGPELEPFRGRNFKKVGFNCTSKHIADPYEKLEFALSELREDIELKSKQILDVFDKKIESINEKIANKTEKLTSEKSDLESYRNNIKILNSDKEKTELEVSTLKKNIHELYKDLAGKKKKLVEDSLRERLNEAESELSKLIDNSQILAEKKYEVNKRIYDENKDKFGKRVQRFEKLREQTEELLHPILNKIKIINGVGFTQSSIQLLYWIGSISLFAAGWFYSVFILERKINSESYLSFFLKRIVRFGDEQFKNGGLLGTLVILIGALLGILLLISFVVYVSDRILRKYSNGPPRNTIVINFESTPLGNESGANLFQLKSRNKSAFVSWFQIIPFVLLAGLAFILISLFSSSKEPNDLVNLLTSLSGQFIGMVFALATTGIMILYISFVIEPRYYAENKNATHFSKNFEIIFILVLFFISMVFVIADNFQNDNSSNQAIIFSSFFLIVLFTSFTLGFGIKFKGLYQEAVRLRSDVKNINLAIEHFSGPQELDTKLIENNKFKGQYETCLEKFFTIIKVKNNSVAELIDDDFYEKSIIKRFIISLRKIGSTKSHEIREITTIEEKYFPEIKNNIDNLRTDLNRKENLFEKINKKIEEIESSESSVAVKILEKIDKLEVQIANYHSERISTKEIFHRKQNDIKQHYLESKDDLEDGFGLGIWHRNSQNGFLKEKTI